MKAADDDLRDAHLLAALRHAPDRDAMPDARLSQSILAQARSAVTTAALLPTRAEQGWRASWQRWAQRVWQPAPMAAFGSLAMAAVIGLLWQGQELPEPAPSLQPAPAPVARPAERDVRASAEAVAVPPAAAPAPAAPNRATAPPPRAAPREPRAAPPTAAPAAPADALVKRPEAADRPLADALAQAPQSPQAPDKSAKAARSEAGAAEGRARSTAPVVPRAPPALLALPSPRAAAGAAAAPLAPVAAAIEAATARVGASVAWRVATAQREVEHAALQRSWWNALQAATEGRWQVAVSTASSTPGSVALRIDGRAQGEIQFEAQALVWRDAAGSVYRAALPESSVRELQEAVTRW